MTETERETIKKEHAQGTMAQKSTQTKTVEKVQGHDKMRVLFNLCGTVLKKDVFVLCLSSIKVGIFYLFCFKLSNILPTFRFTATKAKSCGKTILWRN